MKENLKKNHRCCFTGHRPHKLKMREKDSRRLLDEAIDNAIAAGYRTFMTGMAEGVDITAAEIIIEKKNKIKELRLICALPHPGFGNGRTEKEKHRFNDIIKKSDYVITISEEYFRGCYQKRNKYMVDNCSLVIAIYNGSVGGTKNTVAYARKNGLEIVNVLDRQYSLI